MTDEQLLREALKALEQTLPFVKAYLPDGEYAQLEAGIQQDVLEESRETAAKLEERLLTS